MIYNSEKEENHAEYQRAKEVHYLVDMSNKEMKHNLQNADFSNIKTKWLNNESMNLITSFGKNIFLKDSVEVNKIHNPVLYRYYLKGNWDIY